MYVDDDGNRVNVVYPPSDTGGGGEGGGGGGSSGGGSDPYGFQNVYGTSIPPDVLKSMTAAMANGDADTSNRYFEQWFTSQNGWWGNGRANGLYSNWAQYQDWRNNIDQVYQQYYGHGVSDAEVAGYANAGHNSTWAEGMARGQAAAGALAAPIKGLFSDAEIQAMSSGSIQGQQLTNFASWLLEAWPTLQALGKPIDRNSAYNAYTSGTPANVYATANLGGAPGAYQNQMMPSTRMIFTPDELREIDQFRAGNITPNGGSLSAFADYAESIRSYAIEYGNPIPTRDQIQSMYNSGLSPGGYAHGQDRIENQRDRDASTAQNAADRAESYALGRPIFPAAVRAYFTPSELAQLDSGRGDPNITTFASYVAEIVDYSIRYGKPIPDRKTIQALFDKGEQAATYSYYAQKSDDDARQAAAEARADARAAAAEAQAKAERLANAQADVAGSAPDWTRVSSAQGAPGFTNFDAGAQQAVAQQEAGLGNTLGARWQNEIEKAINRMKANFSGVLQNLDRSGYGFMAEQRPDVGA